MTATGSWVATITPTRHGYRVQVHGHASEELGTYFRFTRSGAERVGRRRAAKHNLDEKLRRLKWTVKP